MGTPLPPNPGPGNTPPAAAPPITATATPTGAASSGGTTTPPPDIRKQAFDFAADATKQLITVATGVIAATVIFSKDLDTVSRYLALIAWGVLILSVVFGIFALLSMVGSLHNALASSSPPALSADIHGWSQKQFWTFLTGMVFVMAFGFSAAGVKSPPETKPLTVNCIVPNLPAPVIVQVPVPARPAASPTKKRQAKQGPGKH